VQWLSVNLLHLVILCHCHKRWFFIKLVWDETIFKWTTNYHLLYSTLVLVSEWHLLLFTASKHDYDKHKVQSRDVAWLVVPDPNLLAVWRCCLDGDVSDRHEHRLIPVSILIKMLASLFDCHWWFLHCLTHRQLQHTTLQIVGKIW